MTETQITLDTILDVPESIYSREIQDEMILLDTEGGTYFGLDPVGTRMWQLICEHGALRTVYDLILEEYDVSPDLLETDLIDLAGKFVEKGLAAIQTTEE